MNKFVEATCSCVGCTELYIIKDVYIVHWFLQAFYIYSDVIHLFDWKSAVEHDGGV